MRSGHQLYLLANLACDGIMLLRDKMVSIYTLIHQYYEIAERLDVPREYVRFARKPQDNGTPHIEYDGKTWFYIVTEKGQEFERRNTANPDDILYWMISDLTFEMAFSYERANRKESEDFRRQMFNKHIELLKSINPAWAERKEKEIQEILSEVPYDSPPSPP